MHALRTSPGPCGVCLQSEKRHRKWGREGEGGREGESKKERKEGKKEQGKDPNGTLVCTGESQVGAPVPRKRFS